MKMYKENPKTKGSGIVCCIPHSTPCLVGCKDCFFQSGRSYLEPLAENLPNMPTVEQVGGRVVRVNDGNDSNIQRDLVIKATKKYKHKFYNTSIPNLRFPAPVVLTINPAERTNTVFHMIDNVPENLMFVRIRVNTWNIALTDRAVEYYVIRGVPVVLTFMAYYREVIPGNYQKYYTWRKRTLNSYWAITTAGYERIISRYKYTNLVYTCGHNEGELGNTKCKHCGNCLREFFATMERISPMKEVI